MIGVPIFLNVVLYQGIAYTTNGTLLRDTTVPIGWTPARPPLTPENYCRGWW